MKRLPGRTTKQLTDLLLKHRRVPRVGETLEESRKTGNQPSRGREQQQ